MYTVPISLDSRQGLLYGSKPPCQTATVLNSKRHIRTNKGRIWLKINGRCVCYEKQVHFTNDFSKDHVITKARGGDQDFADTVPGQAFVLNV
jgi:hypothetical protein